jgi:hypothetical protein
MAPSDADNPAPLPTAPQSGIGEPRSVRTALLLLGTSWTMSVIVLLRYFHAVVWEHVTSFPEAPALLVIGALYYSFYLWLIRAIGQRQAWPRYFLLGVTPLNLIWFVILRDPQLPQDLATRGLNVGRLTLQTAALCLLFLKSARQWSQTASDNHWRGP